MLFLFSDIIQEFKDKAIADAHAAKSQIQGSKKKMVTSTNISSQPSKSSKESKNKNSSKDKWPCELIFISSSHILLPCLLQYCCLLCLACWVKHLNLKMFSQHTFYSFLLVSVCKPFSGLLMLSRWRRVLLWPTAWLLACWGNEWWLRALLFLIIPSLKLLAGCCFYFKTVNCSTACEFWAWITGLLVIVACSLNLREP